MTPLRTALLAASLAFAPGCPQGPAVDLPPPPAQTPARAPEPWLYAPALHEAIPAGLAVRPVFELADGHKGRAEIGVAVASPGAAPRLEVWEFSQNNPKERLQRVGEARELVALDAPREARGQLDAIRTAIARPGNEFVRMRGLDGEPEAIVAELQRLAATVRDEAASPELRAEALASLTRALDDHLLFTENRLPGLLAALAGELVIASREPVGERRVIVTTREPPHRLTFARTGDRWALVELQLALASAPKP
ncbi:hypothetical protein [Nannocystis bainbridge]|uniref:Lipoprotein n=1 Tax=Nannocystis bainbridge TaxID=2995303 RepID=A0ABT5DX90_9BACT|nr:hypothetical protein [Nannocystis bainbridge]MDC0718237.1 hypothetical protein [Nannocystis bainbridge]